ncbi:MAG: hypothetical protein ACRC62_20025 [Microcoleus sp.]
MDANSANYIRYDRTYYTQGAIDVPVRVTPCKTVLDRAIEIFVDRTCNYRSTEKPDLCGSGMISRRIVYSDISILQRAMQPQKPKFLLTLVSNDRAANALTILILTGTVNLGRKILYPLGKATGDRATIDRSQAMIWQLCAIGFGDTPDTRTYLSAYLYCVFLDPTNIAEIQVNGRVIKESLLMGPIGALKMKSVWDGNKLITIILFGKEK